MGEGRVADMTSPWFLYSFIRQMLVECFLCAKKGAPCWHAPLYLVSTILEGRHNF